MTAPEPTTVEAYIEAALLANIREDYPMFGRCTICGDDWLHDEHTCTEQPERVLRGLASVIAGE